MKPAAPPAVSRAAERSVEELAERVLSGDRASLARAITLIESRRVDHRAQAGALSHILADHLHGHVATDAVIAAQVHDAHAALTEQSLDGEAAVEERAWRQTHPATTYHGRRRP